MQHPVDSLRHGGLVSHYELVPFSGGTVRVRLVTNGDAVAEWMVNEYAFPVAATIARTTTNLLETSSPQDDVVLSPRSPLLVGAWQVADRDRGWREHTNIQIQFGDPSARATPYVYALPFSVGETHRLGQGFNGKFSHNGDDAFAIDFEMPEGTVVRAARDGTVVAFNDAATDHGLTPEFHLRSHANWIIVLHRDGTLGEYWHLLPHGVRVQIGQHVARGDVLGLSGFTGHTSNPHLHFEVRTAVDGFHVRSYPFVLKAAANAPNGEAPVEGKSYTAFE